uniref:Uncharacterized protein n=1 Tax=Arundo donax TaxID=35708 RepID=A0A0A8YLI0_ARUDO
MRGRSSPDAMRGRTAAVRPEWRCRRRGWNGIGARTMVPSVCHGRHCLLSVSGRCDREWGSSGNPVNPV